MMLRTEDLSKRYLRRGHEIAALDAVSLSVAEGEFASIMGPSGSGKSTLLLALGGLIHPSQGKVYLDGKSLYDLPREERAALRRTTIGFVFQTFNLVPYLTALENVQVPLYLNRLSRAKQRERAADLLSKVGLGDRLGHKPSELSVGEQQRVALARTLANKPHVILADEPTGNLDPALADEMLDHLSDLQAGGATVVMVTHDPRMAARAKRQIRLAEGRIVTTESGESQGVGA